LKDNGLAMVDFSFPSKLSYIALLSVHSSNKACFEPENGNVSILIKQVSQKQFCSSVHCPNLKAVRFEKQMDNF